MKRRRWWVGGLAGLFVLVIGLKSVGAEAVARLPLLEGEAAEPVSTDWLVTPSERRAGVYRTQRDDQIVLDNGLIRRTFRLKPNGATVGLDNLMTGQAVNSPSPANSTGAFPDPNLPRGELIDDLLKKVRESPYPLNSSFFQSGPEPDQ